MTGPLKSACRWEVLPLCYQARQAAPSPSCWPRPWGRIIPLSAPRREPAAA